MKRTGLHVLTAGFLATTSIMAAVSPAAAGSVSTEIVTPIGTFTLSLETAPLDIVEVGETVVISGTIDPPPPAFGSPTYKETEWTLPPSILITSASIGSAYGTCDIGLANNALRCYGGENGTDGSFTIEAIAVTPGVAQNITMTLDVPFLPVFTTLSTSLDVATPTTTSDLVVLPIEDSTNYAGETTSVEAIVFNGGTAPLDDVALEATGDEVLTLQRALVGSDAGPCSTTPSTSSCTIGTLAPGEAHRITVEFISAPTATNASMTFDATTTTPEETPDPHPNQRVLDITLLPPTSDVAVYVTLQSDPPSLTGRFTQRLAVWNFGPSPVQSVVLTAEIPPGHTFERLLDTDGLMPTPVDTCVPTATTVTCDLGPLSSRDASYFSFQTIAQESIASTSTVSVSSASLDPVPGNNVVSSTIPAAVPGVAHLVAGPSPVPHSIERGTSGTQEIVWTNTGSAAATDLVVTYTAPDDWVLSNARLDPQPSTCSIDGQTATCATDVLFNGDNLALSVDLVAPNDAVSAPVDVTLSHAAAPGIDHSRSYVITSAILLPISLTNIECFRLFRFAGRFGHNTNAEFIASVIPFLAVFVSAPNLGDHVANGIDPGETCLLDIPLTDVTQQHLQTIADELEVAPDEAAAATGRFIIALLSYFFGG